MDWTGISALATLGLLVVALGGFLFQWREARRARSQTSRVAEKNVETFVDLARLKEELSGLRDELEPGGLSDSLEERLRHFEERVGQLEGSIWSAMTVALDAGKRPLVNAGAMHIHVPAIGEFVVDVAMLVNALKDSPMEMAELRRTPGGVFINLEHAIQPAEERGLVRVVRDIGPEAVQLTDKGRLLARILEAEEELRTGA